MLNINHLGFEAYWHPVVKVQDSWQLFGAALVGQHGSEIDQDVDHIGLELLSTPAGEVLRISYSDHAYEHYFEWNELEDERELIEASTWDSEGEIFCRRTPKLVCSSPILTKLELYGDAKIEYSAKLTLDGDQIVVSEVEARGPVVYENREDMWEFAGPLVAGTYPFPD